MRRQGTGLEGAVAMNHAPVGAGYLDKVDVARLLRLSPKTVGQWANQGKLPGHRIGGRLRFKWAEIERWMEGTKIKKEKFKMQKCEPHGHFGGSEE